MEQQCDCLTENLTEQDAYNTLHKVIVDYDRQPGNLIQILHMAQAIFGYLPEPVQRFICTEMNLSVSEVSGVVSFYSYFTTQPRGRHTIQVCLGTACYVRGGKKVLEGIKEALKIDVGETTEDRRFSLEVKRCIGACGLAPAVMIDGTVHKRVNPNKLQDMLNQYK
ncbi:MAG: NAD(P)H-dependent oxidoreductase subunit E [Ruminococcaceae bacterium]|jgi:NADH:ubiquinone oxidoreductase subunit E|nr:NAD(P)H-dependent oxidoreductase subunit E [Oscillospiraceae bacterium]